MTGGLFALSVFVIGFVVDRRYRDVGKRIFAAVVLVDFKMEMRSLGNFHKRGISHGADFIARLDNGARGNAVGYFGLQIPINGFIAVRMGDDDGLSHHGIEFHRFDRAVRRRIDGRSGIRFEVDAEMDAVILHRIREYRNIGRPFL